MFILEFFSHISDIKFSSSGREDVDVRCLGNGRPFVVEFINPQRTKLSREEITSMQLTINTSTKLIRVRDLQIVEKYGHLKSFVVPTEQNIFRIALFFNFLLQALTYIYLSLFV